MPLVHKTGLKRLADCDPEGEPPVKRFTRLQIGQLLLFLRLIYPSD